MTLDQLQVLQTIVTTGSFRAASQELQRAQSAVSYAVGTLEKELGFKLFSRDKYRPSLTPQGKAFLKKADDLIFQFGELGETAQLLKRGYEPIIRLAISALFPLPYMVDALKDFTSQFPQTEIKIINDVQSNGAQIMEDHADIVLGPIIPEQNPLKTQELLKVKMICVCHAKHALAKTKGNAPPASLLKFPQIMVNLPASKSERAKKLENVISVQDYETLKALVIAGLGWGLMPEHLVSEEIKEKKLIALSTKPTLIAIHAVRHSGKPLGPCGKYLWERFCRRQKSTLN